MLKISHCALRNEAQITYKCKHNHKNFLNGTSDEKENLLLTLIAGKRIRVWTGTYSAVLHRSPSLYSAYSASFSSLTRENTLTDIFHLFGFRLGSTEGQIKQQLPKLYFLIYSTNSPQCICAWKKISTLTTLSIFALLLMHLLVFQGLSAKYRKIMC